VTKKGLTLDELKKIFPHLAQELRGENQSMPISGVRSDPSPTEEWKGYSPDVIDFLRRCTTIAEGLEIIDFLESQQEITPDYAKRLRKQLRNQGIRSFGSKKEQDFYLKKARKPSTSC
jgi:hypothetical protein